MADRISQLRDKLGVIQSQLQRLSTSVSLINDENIAISTLNKMPSIEESTVRQKSRIAWLKHGDDNTWFFFHDMKERFLHNSIDIIYNARGENLTHAKDIHFEVTTFYQQLLGTAATSLTSADVDVLRAGNQVSTSDSTMLISDVSNHKIDAALWALEDFKAPGIYGFNSFFFNKV